MLSSFLAEQYAGLLGKSKERSHYVKVSRQIAIRMENNIFKVGDACTVQVIEINHSS